VAGEFFGAAAAGLAHFALLRLIAALGEVLTNLRAILNPKTTCLGRFTGRGLFHAQKRKSSVCEVGADTGFRRRRQAGPCLVSGPRVYFYQFGKCQNPMPANRYWVERSFPCRFLSLPRPLHRLFHAWLLRRLLEAIRETPLGVKRDTGHP
jgi:hypothetical protein